MPARATVDAFVALVVSGKHDEAIARFYREDASMQENLDPPRKGRAGLIARERAVMAHFKEIRSTCAGPVLRDGDNVVIRWLFEFVRADGTSWTMDELAYQRWDGEKIAEERFYYDPSQRKM